MQKYELLSEVTEAQMEARKEISNLITVSTIPAVKLALYHDANAIAARRIAQLFLAATQESKQVDELANTMGRSRAYILAKYYGLRHAH